ncbi:MAG: efflux RND transporter periplasmic adaptor subunit [Candidatus Latescibacteria bacterium]|nr:efflux RND transporter periplasmic adaptor subunit [Candidatus Latescibacterota bacterium]
MKTKRIVGLVFVAVIVAAAGYFLYARNQGKVDYTEHAAAGADTTAMTGHEGHDMAKMEEQKPGGPKKILYYRDPMHPAYTSPKPGTAPDCGMDLVPVYEGEEAVTVTVPGLATVTISPERQQLIGVKTEVVTRQTLDKTLRTVGRVDYDERRLAHIHTKTEGWIQHLHVDYTGQLVQKGQPLLTIYSPELVATQEEYLLALRGRQSLTKSRFTDVAAGSQSLVESARRRLQLWDISDEQIAQLEKAGKPQTMMTLYSPIQGFVVEKMAFEGKKVDGSEDLYLIADLSAVWVYADIYEYELPLIKVGQPASVTLSYEPGKIFTGKVVYIYPALDPMTRTAKVRVEFANPGWTLKPQMYANIEIKTGQGEGLVVPDGAVLDSGTRQIVFVDKGGGRFEPREVKVGLHLTGAYEIRAGLQEGERVITSANFLIDSESQLKAAIGQMGMKH